MKGEMFNSLLNQTALPKPVLFLGYSAWKITELFWSFDLEVVICYDAYATLVLYVATCCEYRISLTRSVESQSNSQNGLIIN